MTLHLHVVVVQQAIKHAQVRRLHLDLRDGGDLLGTFHGGLDGRKRDRFAAGQRRPQGILHGRLAFPGRQLQKFQVFPHGPLVRVLPAQRVVRHAEMARGEQILMVLVVGEGARLADQRVDDVPVVDGVLADARQPRHALDHDAGVPYLHLLHADHHVHLPADQAAVDRVSVSQNPDRAACPHPDIGQPPRAFHTSGRQRAEGGQLFQKPLLPLLVASGRQLAEKPQVLFTVGEVTAAA